MFLKKSMTNFINLSKEKSKNNKKKFQIINTLQRHAWVTKRSKIPIRNDEESNVIPRLLLTKICMWVWGLLVNSKYPCYSIRPNRLRVNAATIMCILIHKFILFKICKTSLIIINSPSRQNKNNLLNNHFNDK